MIYGSTVDYFDRKPISSIYDKVGKNTVRMEEERDAKRQKMDALKRYLELF